MKPVFVESVGFAAPGMPTWQSARAVLRGEQPHVYSALVPHAPALLPVNERRRATPAVRLAFQASEDAMQATPIPAAALATVFASSDAELAIIHRICLALAQSPRLISPTDFHNSVHNAAAGYWHIAAAARTASSTISAYDGSFAAGLVETCLQVQVDSQNTMLVAFDLPAPEPLHTTRPIAHPAAVAMVLTRGRSPRTLAQITCAFTDDAESSLPDSDLEVLRLGNPAARSLTLLRRIARAESGRVVLPGANGGNVAVECAAP
jgi:hypothetical protein